jgi:hypothetical protein
LKLQTNTKGSWANFIDFAADQEIRVRDLGAGLVEVATNRMSARIVDDNGVVLALCEKPPKGKTAWRAARAEK